MIELGKLAPQHPDKVEAKSLSDDQIRTVLNRKIVEVSAEVEKPNRHITYWQRKIRGLVNIDGDEPYPILVENGKVVGKAEPDQLQEVAYELMTWWGLDPEVSRKVGEETSKQGIKKEIRDFPSSTHPGLVFQRVYEVNNEGHPVYLSWIVVDETPLAKITIGNKTFGVNI